MRATRVKKYRTRPPRRPCNAKKAKTNNFPNAGVEKFLSSSRQWRCVVTPLAQLLEKTIWNETRTGQATRNKFPRAGVGKVLVRTRDVFQRGRQESIKYRKRQPRSPCKMRRNQKSNFQNAGVEIFVFVRAVAVCCHATCTTIGKYL